MNKSNIFRSKKWLRKAIPIPIWLWGNFWFSCGHEARRKCDVQNFIELFKSTGTLYKGHTVMKFFIELELSVVFNFSVWGRPYKMLGFFRGVWGLKIGHWQKLKLVLSFII